MRQSDSGNFAQNFSLSDYIAASPCPAHAVQTARQFLQACGAQALRADERWKLEPGSLYFLEISRRSLFAFRTPLSTVSAFRLMGAHTDSPCFRLRERSVHWEDGLLVTGTEPYGGVIFATWLDRPLSIAGVAQIRMPDGSTQSHLIELPDIHAIIPNLAIHLNRDINKGYEFNSQTQLRVLVPLASVPENREKPWEWLVAKQLSAGLAHTIAVADILALDLFLSDAQAPFSFGNPPQLISSPRVDNLAGCHALLRAIGQAQSSNQGQVQLACLFDHEEIGSRSNSGADSIVLLRLLRRIALASGLLDEEDFLIAIEHSLLASVDAAHARHPNFADKHDADYSPQMNAGIVLKSNVNHRYATAADGSAKLATLCAKQGIPLQYFTNRADMGCGSTIGPSLTAMTGISAIDLGIPILAMHSCRETAGLQDQEWMIAALAAFLEEN